jgi:diaminohydroxyphosphoribosylaminopyrimidine deaminase/5-amino-6-(5-phosphoribosylamino)uracil reductase
MPETTLTERDQRHLLRSIELAAEARGHTSPNPLVGAVVVKSGRVIGEGFHAGPGEAHAERVALGACGEDAAGATMYVSLEPCCHHGRTPPCTDAILDAGIARVVIASDDPSAKASGRGPDVLAGAGIEIAWANGGEATKARHLNQPFRKHARTGRPYVTLKSAITLDGRTATRTGDSQWISDPDSRVATHEQRAQADAVAVGIGTALADDPQLTVRLDTYSGRQPARVVFDSAARLPLSSQLVATVDGAPLIVITSEDAPAERASALERAGAEVIACAGEPAEKVRAALDRLGERGMTSLLLEGGPELAGSFNDAGEIDALVLFVGPILFGGADARPLLGGIGAASVADARRATAVHWERLSDADVRVEAVLREW